MDKRLHLLESFTARGSDDRRYVVRGYEHLARLPGVLDMVDQWEPTGQVEYRLEDGRAVSIEGDGTMVVTASRLRLKPDSTLPRDTRA